MSQRPPAVKGRLAAAPNPGQREVEAPRRFASDEREMQGAPSLCLSPLATFLRFTLDVYWIPVPRSSPHGEANSTGATEREIMIVVMSSSVKIRE